MKNTQRVNLEKLEEAICIIAEKHGGLHRALDVVKISPKSVSLYRAGRRTISPEFTAKICAAGGRKVKKEDILPDYDWSIFK